MITTVFIVSSVIFLLLIVLIPVKDPKPTPKKPRDPFMDTFFPTWKK
jgi:hypothetical protein